MRILKKLFYFPLGLSHKISPFKAALLVTERCNSRCQFCYVWKNKNIKDLSTEKWFEILDKLWDFGIKELSFHGGEPLLKKDLLELNAYAKKKGFKTQIITNGILTTDYSQFDTVLFSLDGIKEETHNFLRGVNLYKNLMKNIEKALKMTKVGISTVIIDINNKEIREIIKFCAKKGIKYMNACPMRPLGVKDYEKKRHLISKIEEVRKETLKNIDFAKKKGIKFSINKHQLNLILDRVKGNTKYIKCHTVNDDCIVDSQGTFFFCCGVLPSPFNVLETKNIKKEWIKKVRKVNFNNKICNSCQLIGDLRPIAVISGFLEKINLK